MRTERDVQRFLSESAIPFQDLGDGLFVVQDAASGLRHLAIKVEPPLVVFRTRVGSIPPAGAANREALFEELLRLNGAGLVHSAFSLSDDGVYLTAALPLDNLDQNELQAVVDDIGMAVSQHLPRLGFTSVN
ncbi:MAG: CesT family type III secretion system chaperone [Myxococcales bacterium]|nr:CesT family type III secretion system chaperone [Myxococcales bacterium]